MAAKSTMDRYGTVAITIHWVAAALIVALLVSGFRVSGACRSRSEGRRFCAFMRRWAWQSWC